MTLHSLKSSKKLFCLFCLILNNDRGLKENAALFLPQEWNFRLVKKRKGKARWLLNIFSLVMGAWAVCPEFKTRPNNRKSVTSLCFTKKS